MELTLHHETRNWAWQITGLADMIIVVMDKYSSPRKVANFGI